MAPNPDGEPGGNVGGSDVEEVRPEGEGVPPATAAQDESEKVPFAFSKCTNVMRKGSSAYQGECQLCGKQLSTTAHKMMYGHYLQKKGQHISVFCISVSKLQKDHEDFFQQLTKRWEALETKRGIRFGENEKDAKRQKALMEGVDEDVASTVSGWSGLSSSVSKGKEKEGAGSMISYAFLPPKEKARLRGECQTAWDEAFVVCGIKFNVADHPAMRRAIEKTRSVPDFKLACAKTMRTSRLTALNESANEHKELRLASGLRFGFAITSDGWRSVAKRNYHNFILLSNEGPIFLRLSEVTGHGTKAEDISDEFEEQFKLLEKAVFEAILIGITDTPSYNRKAWRLLEAKHPQQFWIGCAAHEVSLLLKEWVKKVPEILQLFKDGHRIVKWVNNHTEILRLYRDIVPKHFADKRKHCLTLYSPGDTRMASVFRMLHRILILFPVLTDLFSRGEYEECGQKALKQ